MLGDNTSAAAAYVANTRARNGTLTHMVATNITHPNEEWIEIFSRGRADLGTEVATARAWDEIETHGLLQKPKNRPSQPTTELDYDRLIALEDEKRREATSGSPFRNDDPEPPARGEASGRGMTR